MEWSQLGLVTDQNWEWFPKAEDGNLCCRICLGWDIRISTKWCGMRCPSSSLPPQSGWAESHHSCDLSWEKYNFSPKIQEPGGYSSWRFLSGGIWFFAFSPHSLQPWGSDSGDSRTLLCFTTMNSLLFPKFPIKNWNRPCWTSSPENLFKGPCPTQEILELGRNSMGNPTFVTSPHPWGCGSSLFPFHHF